MCELAAILTVLASLPVVAQAGDPVHRPEPDQVQEEGGRQPITYEMVYGPQRLTIGGFVPFRITWLDDEHYIRRESSGWQRYSAETGSAEAWYDVSKLAESLHAIDGISVDDARRLAAGGWMEMLPDRRLVVFRHQDRLIRISLDGGAAAVVAPVPPELELASLSPTGTGLAWVSKDELWAADFETGTVRQLTHDATATVRNGKADWVYYEELYDRDWQAYRWSPDGRWLAYQQFDDSQVPLFQISDHTTVEQAFETERYPKAGGTNPTVRLGVVPLAGGETVWINTADFPLDDLLIVHFNWLPNSSALYWYAQNRVQTWLQMMQSNPATGDSFRLLRDETPAWTDNPKDVTFLADGSFLIFSERSGWKHLYRVSADGKSIQPVTSGQWEVRALHAVSEDESSVVVSGTLDSPIAENLYRVSLSSQSITPVRLTPDSGHHVASVSSRGSFFADSRSALNEPVSVTMRRGSDGEPLRTLEPRATVPSDRYRFGSVEFVELPMADGTTTTGILIRPPDFDPARKYPVWLKTYGGPHAPQVRDIWNSRLPDHLLANQGIVVLHWDPRSASGRGARSAWLAWRKLGVEETRDLVSVCDWLKTQPWVDSTRIGQSGHSYGGYFTACAMTRTDCLCAGISGAPVTDWANYDTIYTERYMGTPAANPDGYRQASVVAEAAALKGRLLLLHGLRDDNVHPENTIQLMHALQQAGRPFEVMFYPRARHGLSGDHYNRLMFNFIVRAMGRGEEAQP
jgi:dipeptidyl-peptidase-4